MCCLPLALLACAWTPPDNPNPLAVSSLRNTIAGTVAWPGEGDPSTTSVTIYEADRPGPPAGTGAPLTFAMINPDAFTTATSGLMAASFATSNLPDGDFLVNALMDVDGDFHPFTGVLAGATCGDWVGTHLESLDSTASGIVTASGGVRVDDVPVVLGIEVLTERPVFQFVQPPLLSKQTGRDSATDPLRTLEMLYRLRATGLSTALGDDLELQLGGPCAPDPAIEESACGSLPSCACDPASDPCDTAFWLWMVDDDGDGLVDPHPGEAQAASGVLNVWPRIYLEFLGERTLDASGVGYDSGLAEGERWVSENFPMGLELIAAGSSAAGIGPVGLPFPANEVSVLWSPVFQHYWAGGQDGEDAAGPFDLVDLRDPALSIEDVPSGSWSLTLVSWSGQTWTLPNDVGNLGLPSFDPIYDNTTQAEVLTLE